MNAKAQSQNETTRSTNELLEAKTKELEVANKKLAELEQLKAYFVSTISHELRTPLTSVIGFAINSLKYYENDILPALAIDDKKIRRRAERVKQNLSIVVSEGERLTCLINDLLGIARMEVGNNEWNVQDVDIITICQRAIAAMAGYPKSPDVEVRFEFTDNVRLVKGDTDKLVQVIANLISNALNATEQGSVTLKVEPCEENAKITVTDTGHGIAKEEMPGLFEKFKQVNDIMDDRPHMTGLGLHMCKEIVEHLGGTMWSESEAGKGSSFCFTLNYCSADEKRINDHGFSTLKDAEKFLRETVNDKNKAKPYILAVDDDANILRLLKQELEEEYNVVLVNSGKDAIKLLTEKPEGFVFDMVITDLLMKGVDGIGVLKEAKKINQDTVVIILTAYGDLQSAIDALKLDVDDYILKPFKSETINLGITRCLEKRELKKKIKLYEKILPVCCECKKIRDDEGKAPGSGEWLSMETYLHSKTKVDVSHGHCPECHSKFKERLKEIDNLQER
ncbi:MAG: ATP-binding protein [Candidatus Anammoxibacter sp.]